VNPSNRPAQSQRQSDNEDVARLATEILVAYLPGTPVPPADLPQLVRDLRAALQGHADVPAQTYANTALQAAPAPPPAQSNPEIITAVEPATLQPAFPIEDSINDDYLVSLEDGKRYRSLRRHLMAKYGMTPDDYRRKWALPPDYPMVAPSYARDRSEVAKRIGLGRLPQAEKPVAPERARRLAPQRKS
jgi:predicted transcriptional regulator